MASVASLRGIQLELPAAASAAVAAEAARGPLLGTHVRRPFRGTFTRSQALALFDSAVFSNRICCNALDLSSLLGYARTPPPDLCVRAKIICSAQGDEKGGQWWNQLLRKRQELSQADSSRDKGKSEKFRLWPLDRQGSENAERPNWLPSWVPDTPPEWLETSVKQAAQVSRLAAAMTLAVGTAAFLRVLAFNPSCVPSASMVPTLLPGDCVFVEIGTYRFLRAPTRGDIVVFRPPSANITAAMLDEGMADEDGLPAPSVTGSTASLPQYVKRVVAIGGDTVRVEDGTVFINGRPRVEEAKRINPAKYSLPSVRVPSHTLFVLGDNRNRSADSHVWGFLPDDQVVGRSWLRWKPLSRFSLLK